VHPIASQQEDHLPADTPAQHNLAGRPVAAYWCEVIAYLPASGRSYWLAAAPASSPRLALHWLTDRAELIAEQLDPATAHTARAWIADKQAHQQMLLDLTAGGLFTHTITDDGIRHILSARPVQVTAPPWEGAPERVGWPAR
jgi:hypothetical protein